MSNLIKYNNFVVKEKNSVVIDSNAKILEKLNKIKETLKPEMQERIPDPDGFISGLNASVVEQLVGDEEYLGEEGYENEPAELTPTPEEILESARLEAEQIIAEAKAEAIQIRSTAKDNGYADGIALASASFDQKTAELEEDFNSRMQSLEAEYKERFDKMEPELVDALLKVFEKVTHTMAEDKKDMILFLINSVMRNTDLSKDFFIRVSPEDYKFTLNNQNRIYSSVAKDVHIDIAEDATLSRNQCIIETDAGVFDCSLDIQLENLIKDIRLLSCMND